MDGNVAIYTQFILDADDPVMLYVLSCQSIRF